MTTRNAVRLALVILAAGCGSDAAGDDPSARDAGSTDARAASDAGAAPDSAAHDASADAAKSPGPCAGSYLLCDDFDAPSVDTSKWTVGDTDIAHKYPVRPENVRVLDAKDDDGAAIRVVDATMYGDSHTPARQGGLLITQAQYGGGRYEARMKSLPGPNGCTCLWNYYDSDNEQAPPATRIYTEIDIEMPAHIKTPPDWASWKRTLGFNTWSNTDSDSDATYIAYASTTADPFDGRYHVYRWDWYDGANGDFKIDWYVDGILQSSTDKHISPHPAQLWVGNWPAPWSGMDYAFDTAHMYIDWVRISKL